MKKIKPIYLSVSLLICIWASCAYESAFSLSDASSSKTDSTLYGNWRGKDTDGNETTIRILKFNDSEYLIEYITQNAGNLSIEKFRGFSTPVGSHLIMNVQAIGEKKGKFSFYRVLREGKTLEIHPVSDSYTKQQFNSRDELRRHFEKHYLEQGFYEQELYFDKAS